jgi:hypothetical protein
MASVVHVLGRGRASSQGSAVCTAWTGPAALLLARDQQLRRVPLQRTTTEHAAHAWPLEPAGADGPGAEVVHMRHVARRGDTAALLTLRADGSVQLWQHDAATDSLRAAHAPVQLAPPCPAGSTACDAWRRLGGMCVPHQQQGAREDGLRHHASLQDPILLLRLVCFEEARVAFHPNPNPNQAVQ